MEYVRFDEESDDFTVKYAPTKVGEIMGCRRQVSALSQWLKDYADNRDEFLSFKRLRDKRATNRGGRKANTRDSANSGAGTTPAKKAIKTKSSACAVVTGDHGCGKTAIVKAVLNSHGYKIRTVNFAKLSASNISSFTHSLLECDGVYTFIDEQNNHTGATQKVTDKGQRVPEKIAIMIDEVESISSTAEKQLINMLLSINNDNWMVPVIFISNNKHRKLITTLTKECFHVPIYQPEVDDMFNMLVRIGESEKMHMVDASIADSIIEHAGFDYRKMISTLQMLHKVYGEESIDRKMLDAYLRFTDQRDVDRSIYENTIKLFTEFKNIETTLRIFEGDKVNMPLMVHQNHFLALSDYVYTDFAKLSAAEDITSSLATGDLIENYIYSDQSWTLQEVQGHHSCVYPSFQLTSVVDLPKLKRDSKYPFGRPAFRTQFPKDLNRTSTRKINGKNIKAAGEFFNDMSVPDYVRANQLIRDLLNDGRVEECKELIDRYNLTHSGVMYVLKIDKVTGTKKTVSKDLDRMVKDITVEPVIKSRIIDSRRKGVKR